jgi:hypothetical protein
VTQRNVEWLLGRLMTDEDLRTAFIRDPSTTLDDLSRQGWELTRTEREALLSKDPATWRDLAQQIPARLKRCSLKTGF